MQTFVAGQEIAPTRVPGATDRASCLQLSPPSEVERMTLESGLPAVVVALFQPANQQCSGLGQLIE
jgi:hypothetical protein